MSLARTLLTTAALGAAVLVPSTAQAAEGFTGVTTDGRVAHLQTDTLPGLNPAPVKVTGLASGERVVGLDRTPSGELHEPDGRLIGIDGAQGAIAAQTAAGSPTGSTLAGLPFKAREPIRTTVASDGSVWTATSLSNDPNKPPQSRLVRYDPATGKLTGASGTFLSVKLAAVASDGDVADDTTKPKGSIRGTVARRHVSHGFSHYGPLGIKVNEPGQVTGQ